MSEKSKKVGEVFSDYKTNSNIKYAYIQALNVNKKTNTLGIILGIDEYVEIKCENCDKPLFVEQQALNNNSSIPCPFCGKRAR